MQHQEQILNKSAKIVILKPYAINGKVLEITPTHHIILTSDDTVIEVKNENVLTAEPKRMKSYKSGVE